MAGEIPKGEEPITEPVGPIPGIGIPGAKIEPAITIAETVALAEPIVKQTAYGEERTVSIKTHYFTVFPESNLYARYNEQKDFNLTWDKMTEEQRLKYKEIRRLTEQLIEESLKA